MVRIGTETTMTPEKWEQVKKIFREVISSPAGERNELVSKLCQGDTYLESQIIKLLAAEKRAGSFLEKSRTETMVPVAPGELSHSLQIGQLIAGRFQIQQFIASGGMGEVYEAWDNELQQKIALKTIRHDIAAHPGIINRFKGEVKESLRITHPNVCRVYQLASHQDGDERPVWFLTMELLEGRTLAQCLDNDGSIPRRSAFALIGQMVSGLACAHQAGIVHRDLKPGNLLLVGSGSSGERLVITDFGLAVSSSSISGGGAAGTPGYMAPEQAMGGQIGPPADIFVVGLILCEIFTGKRRNSISLLRRSAPNSSTYGSLHNQRCRVGFGRSSGAVFGSRRRSVSGTPRRLLRCWKNSAGP